MAKKPAKKEDPVCPDCRMKKSDKPGHGDVCPTCGKKMLNDAEMARKRARNKEQGRVVAQNESENEVPVSEDEKLAQDQATYLEDMQDKEQQKEVQS